MLKMEPGAALPRGGVECIEIRVVLKGAIEYLGVPHAAVSRVYLPPGAEFEAMRSPEGAELLVFQVAAPGGDAPPLRARAVDWGRGCP